MTDIIRFRCPTCETQYKVVKVNASATHNRQLFCMSCGATLKNREGRFALKYFRVGNGSDPARHRQPRMV